MTDLMNLQVVSPQIQAKQDFMSLTKLPSLNLQAAI